jgi:hypothetical protein
MADGMEESDAPELVLHDEDQLVAAERREEVGNAV